jgi:hypothetical protein
MRAANTGRRPLPRSSPTRSSNKPKPLDLACRPLSLVLRLYGGNLPTGVVMT